METYVSKLDPNSLTSRIGINDAMKEVTLQIGYMKTYADNAYDLLKEQLNDLKNGFSNTDLPSQTIDYTHVSETIEAGQEGRIAQSQHGVCFPYLRFPNWP